MKIHWLWSRQDQPARRYHWCGRFAWRGTTSNE